jgi:general secretion pathway protein M
MSRAMRPGVLAWLLLLAAVVAGAAWAGWLVWTKHQYAAARMADIEPRHARLAGILQRETEFTEQVAEVNQRLNELVYPSSVESQAAGTDAQQRVRQLFASAGLNLASSQVLEPKAEGSFDRIPMTVRLDGDLVALQTALSGLDTLRPVVWIDNMSVQTGAIPRDQAPRLNISLNLSVLRGRP